MLSKSLFPVFRLANNRFFALSVMKICPTCNQIYDDDEQNYCLNDGRLLNKTTDDAPPTVYMDAPRITKQNWQNAAPISPWQNQSNLQNQEFATPSAIYGQDQTLPIVSLVFGILSIPLAFCCYAGIPLGIVALITGYVGFNNEKNNPERYGGRGLAIGGMITGGLVLLLSILLFILWVFMVSI